MKENEKKLKELEKNIALLRELKDQWDDVLNDGVNESELGSFDILCKQCEDKCDKCLVGHEICSGLYVYGWGNLFLDSSKRVVNTHQTYDAATAICEHIDKKIEDTKSEIRSLATKIDEEKKKAEEAETPMIFISSFGGVYLKTGDDECVKLGKGCDFGVGVKCEISEFYQIMEYNINPRVNYYPFPKTMISGKTGIVYFMENEKKGVILSIPKEFKLSFVVGETIGFDDNAFARMMDCDI